jgi:hypothetical protein
MDLNRAARTENERTRQCADGHTHPHPTRRPESGRDLRAGFRSERRDEGGRTGMRWSLRWVRTCYFFKVWALGFSSTGSHSSRIAQGSHIAAGRHYQRQQQPAVLSLGPSQGPQTKLPDTAPSHDSPHSSVCSHQVIDQYVFFHRQSLHRVRRPFQVVHGQSPLMVRHHRGCLWPPACPTLTGRRWRRRRGEPCSSRSARPRRSSGTRPGRC